MIINLSPQGGRNDVLEIIKAGDVLTINGIEYDFSVIPDGAELPATAIDCEFIIGTVSRIGGVLNMTMVLPYNTSNNPAVAFPSPIVNPVDGRVPLPTDEVV